ncbi:MAG: Gfo/Idh/MocA family oxidoreductase [Clostridia bacterium]|nr:Gfo/Idh/MocA family oxidoreductase [Clostridia bacterium]
MRRLRVAVIGQGRSGYGIHGKYFASEQNDIVEVVAAVDPLPVRRGLAEERLGCPTYEHYTELYNIEGIDLVINATMSMDHYAVTRDLLEHGFNVLTEKPFTKTEAEARELMALAEEKGVLLAVFQQSLFAPNFVKVKELIASGKLGQIVEIDINYAGFARRWDWQTLQSCCAGSVYNTGPHPIGQALDLLGWDDETRLVYSKLDTTITSGDAEDYAKLLLTAPGKPMVMINLTATDAFGEPSFKVQGTQGTLIVTAKDWKMKYSDPADWTPRPATREPLMDEEGKPIYCSEKLEWTEEAGEIEGNTFTVGTHRFYRMLADAVFEGRPMEIVPEYAARTVAVIEECHKHNPLPVKF